MSQHEKPMKISKILRQKAQEFFTSRKNSNNLVDIVKHFESGADTSPCLLTLELIFTNLLKEKQMYVEVIPLKLVERTAESQYKTWLRNIYEETFIRILDCFQHNVPKIQMQALATAMNILGYEGKYPLESKGNLEHFVPLNRLKLILTKIILNKDNSINLINKLQEYLLYDDILFYTWKVLPSLTAKSNPNEVYIVNYLMLLEKLQVQQNNPTDDRNLTLCALDESVAFQYDENITHKCLNKLWNCVMLWEHTPATHKQLLIVLLERVLPNLDKPLLLTDFLMDSLDIGGPVSLLALQGIFTMIQVYNLDYPNIYAKLYSMFEPEIFHTKLKARLFYLSDMFLSSTHLPENMVAAFAKRLARLALIAPSEDIIVICMFIGNLILRHPGLKRMIDYQPTNNTINNTMSNDPYIMEEREPTKSNAINSSLWEIKTLQSHVLPTVSTAARFINTPLPTIEWDITKVLDNTSDDIFDKEIQKNNKLIALAFDRPNGCCLNNGGDYVSQFWNI